MGLIQRSNDALTVNPPAGDQFLAEHGSDWLWAVAAVYALSFVSLVWDRLSDRRPSPLVMAWY
jgi:bacteriorhodopsin